MTHPTPNVTELLVGWGNGDKAALDQILPIVYDELHKQAARYLRRERAGHTLQTTALIHEAYIRLVDQKNVRWQNRAHFFGISAQLMRRTWLITRGQRDALNVAVQISGSRLTMRT